MKTILFNLEQNIKSINPSFSTEEIREKALKQYPKMSIDSFLFQELSRIKSKLGQRNIFNN